MSLSLRSKRRFLLCLTILVGGLTSVVGGALALDEPHGSVPYPDLQCATACHSLHGTSYPPLLGKLCQNCHESVDPSYPTAPRVQTHSSRTTTNRYGDWDLDCWACHDPHTQQQGTVDGQYVRTRLRARVKLIDPTQPGPYYPPLSNIRTVSSDVVQFQAPAGFVDADAAANDDICQVCHVQTGHMNGSHNHPDLSPDTQPGGDCTACHKHELGFMVDCFVCHGQAQPQPGTYRRQVVGAGGDFERTSHHVFVSPGTQSATVRDCVTCHQVLPSTAASGGHRTHTDPQVRLNHPDTGAGVTYDGTGGSVVTVCLGCHDALGPQSFDRDKAAPGNQPFSDGVTPPDISTRWAAASHGTTTVGQMASERCLGCHGGADATQTSGTRVTDRNMHGSTNPRMLSSFVDNQTVTNVEEELCWGCHDGFPATRDIKAAFALPSHHKVVDSEAPPVEVECLSCHDPHAARPGVHTRGSSVHAPVNWNVEGVYPADGGGALAWNVPAAGSLPAAQATWGTMTMAGRTSGQPWGGDYEGYLCLRCHSTHTTPSAPLPPTSVPLLYFTSPDPGSNPAPDAHQTTDTFNSGTWSRRSAVAANGAADDTAQYTASQTGTKNYRGRSFVSPALSAQTIAAQTWTLALSAWEEDSRDNAFVRARVYVWKADDSGIRAVILDTTNFAITGTAWGNRTWTFAGAAASVTEDDRLVVDAWLQTQNADQGKLFGFRYGTATQVGSIDPTNDLLLTTTTTSGSSLQDVARFFNPNNPSYHAVLGDSRAWTSLPANSFVAGVGLSYSSRLTCSDCHTQTWSTTGTLARGPHGSTNARILLAPYPLDTGKATPNDELCFKCHNPDTYAASSAASNNSTGFSGDMSNLHRFHMQQGAVQGCKSCHVGVPHGYKTYRMLAPWDGGSPGAPGGDPDTATYAPSSKLRVRTWRTSGNWTRPDCQFWDVDRWRDM